MPQLSLFESAASATSRVLVDDERGRIEYRPALIDRDTAARWFEQARDTVAWRAQRRMMYDREVDVPRLTGHYPLSANNVPEVLREAAAIVIDATGVAFNSVGLNLYRDGRDSVAPHNDHLYEIAQGFPIALVSLGDVRTMAIREKTPSDARSKRRGIDVELEPGSLLVMSYETQLHFTHGIPKTDAPVGPRISLAFRVKPATASKRSVYAVPG
jgi:alkylated DNA repair dioxygenase AlkB